MYPAREFFPLSERFFPLLGMIFAPLWAYFFNFSLYICVGKSLLHTFRSLSRVCVRHSFVRHINRLTLHANEQRRQKQLVGEAV